MIITDMSVGLPCVEKVSVNHYKQDKTMEVIEKNIIIEHYLDVYINENLALRMVTTPKDLPALVVGHLLSEGQIMSVDDIESIYVCESGAKAKVFLHTDYQPIENPLEIRACDCGADGILGRNLINCEADVQPLQERQNNMQNEQIINDGFQLIQAFQTGGPIHKLTGGTHSAYMMIDGVIQYEAEDIGRHNALDKVIGMALMDGASLENARVFVSGRVPVDMIQKVIRTKIPVIFSNAVPTREAILLAKQYNVLLFTTARKYGIDEIQTERKVWTI